MARGARWTRRSLERALRELAASDRVTVSIAKHDDCSAESHWREDGRDIFVSIDPERGGAVRCFVHELLHYVLQHDLMDRFVYELEEEMVEALEALIYQRGIAQNARKMDWWRRALRARLSDEEAD